MSQRSLEQSRRFQIDPKRSKSWLPTVIAYAKVSIPLESQVPDQDGRASDSETDHGIKMELGRAGRSPLRTGEPAILGRSQAWRSRVP